MKQTAYWLQGALVIGWWIGLTSNQTFFAAFQFDDIPPTAFWAFLVPDMLMIAVLSLIMAYLNVPVLGPIIFGAFGYATLYCVNASLLTRSGWPPTVLMLLGLCYNGFLCFHKSLFRESTSNFKANFIKTAIQIACTWTLALVAIPYVILDAFETASWPSNFAGLTVGAVVFLGFSSLGLFSAYVIVRDGSGTPLPMDQTNKLVTSGPYRYVCNPMAIAGIGQGLALAIVFWSLPLLIYSIVGAVIWHLVVRPVEERDLERRFGQTYLAYRASVSCWIPNWGAARSQQ